MKALDVGAGLAKAASAVAGAASAVVSAVSRKKPAAKRRGDPFYRDERRDEERAEREGWLGKRRGRNWLR